MKDSLLKNFLKFSYGSLAGLVLGLFTTMLITRILTPEALGMASMFDLAIQVGMILTIFGTDQSFVRFFYEEESDKRGALLFNAIRIPLINTIVLMVIVILFYQSITYFLFGKESLLFAIVLSVGILGQLFLRYGELVIRMQQKGNLFSLLQIFQKLFNLIFIIILFLLLGSTFEVLIFSKVLTILLVVILAVYFGKNFWSLANLKVKNVKHSQREILKYGAPFLLTIFISWLFESFDKIALRQWSSFEELGLYSAAMKLVALVMVVRTTFSTFWTPVAYDRFENHPNDKSFFRYITIIISFLMFLVAIFSVVLRDTIVILLGDDYQMAANIMPFLVFMPVFYTISETTVIGINFYKKVNWHILIAVISCIVNIFGNWLLVPVHGALGASISTAFSFIIYFTLRTVISLKYYKVKYPLVRIYLMTLIVSLYAYFSIIINDFWYNILCGLISLIFLILLFYKDLYYLARNRKSIFN